MVKLEIFDPAMCCKTGICGTNADETLVTFASDLEWLKEQGVDVQRHGISLEPKQFAKNEVVSNVISVKGKGILPLILVDSKVISKGCYPSRKALSEMCRIKYNEEEAPPVHREENCCCGIDCDCESTHIKGCSLPIPGCDCTNAAAENNCECTPESDYQKPIASNNFQKTLFIITLIIIIGIIIVKILL